MDGEKNMIQIPTKQHIVSNETRKKMSDAHSGEKNHNFGKHHSEETRKKMSDAHSGEKHYNWKGGITKDPYCEFFTEDVKEHIREKHGRRCFLCNKTEEENYGLIDKDGYYITSNINKRR